MTKRDKLRALVLETPMKAFLRITSNGGLLLMAMALIAVLWANSPWQQWYLYVFEKIHIALRFDTFELDMHLLHWINDGLMTLFFFMVGLEIKRELLAGELNNVKVAALPIIAAIGGMLIPVAIFSMFGFQGEEARGWGIPMATDIAFSIGILSLLGSRVPLSLKVFLTALAIIDDLGAVLVIAIFYTSQINWLFLGFALMLVAILVVANITNVRNLWFYFAVGIVVWLLFLHSGVHATIAGVLVALTIPVNPLINPGAFIDDIREVFRKFNVVTKDAENHIVLNHEQVDAIDHIQELSREVQSPLQYLEHRLHKFVNYFVLPLFALSNAGIILYSFNADNASTAGFTVLSVGLAVSLVLGKGIGIFIFSWLAVRFKIAKKPFGASWSSVLGVAFLGGIGFTMSLFIASLAFPSASVLAEAKLGIFAGSIIAGIIGYYILKKSLKVNVVEEALSADDVDKLIEKSDLRQ